MTSADGTSLTGWTGSLQFDTCSCLPGRDCDDQLEPEQQLSEAALSSEDGDAVMSMGTKPNANTTAAS